MSNSTLFKPLQVGTMKLSNRIAMAPLTRFRADDDHVPLPFVAECYAQRASVPGTFIVSEATLISAKSGAYANVPGIYTQAQIDSWKRVTEAVHKKGSYIYLQLWHLGRTADPKQTEKEGGAIKAPSAIPMEQGQTPPEELTIPEIEQTVADYAQAAKNALQAGFDGVEIHAANGYLIDQFTQDKTNKRTDAYGGSIAARSRFGLEVTKAVVDAVGADRTGIRLSPFSTFQGMRMSDPLPQFSHLVTGLSALRLAYVHLVESRVAGNADVESFDKLDPLVELWKGPVLVAGGYKPDSARRVVDDEYKGKDVVVVFGRYFIANPDLVWRVREGVELRGYDRDLFYIPKSEKGYTDYAFAEGFKGASL